MIGATTPPAASPLSFTEVGRAGPTISLTQLEPDHALVVVRGEVRGEFLLGLRQHLRNLVDAGVRYVVVDLAEVTACPPQLVSELAATCRASIHGRAGYGRSHQRRVWRPRWSPRL
jgi:hypothetical protein